MSCQAALPQRSCDLLLGAAGGVTIAVKGYAKAGIGRWDLDTELPDLVGDSDDNGNDPTGGLGLQYRINDLVALRDEYSRFEIQDRVVDLAQLQLRFDF